jgi:MoxR-like ATPase
MNNDWSMEERIKYFSRQYGAVRAEIAKDIVGQDEAVDGTLIAMIAGGNVLLEGVPGTGKTRLVRSAARTLDLMFSRIQFTPDLMPADVTGANIIEKDERGNNIQRFAAGPIFSNIILADEINRATPKTQSALLEAMQEHRVTAGGRTWVLMEPFFVLATQNPIELEGTYPLPEAQLDRFLLNIVMDYLPVEEEIKMVKETTSPDEPELKPILDGADIVAIQKLVRQVPVSDNVVEYAVKLCSATRPSSEMASEKVKRMVQWGAGSRASQAMVLAAKARALLDGRRNAAIEDIKALALPILRHRVITNFYANAENVTATDIIRDLVVSD